MKTAAIALAAALAATPALADFNDKKPITATVTGATPSGYPRTMVEGLNAVVRDVYPGSAVSFKPNSPGGGVLAIAEGQADFTATATGTEVRLANEGGAPFSKPLKGKFSYVMQLYDNQYIHFLMTKEWADANGIKSWADIAAPAARPASLTGTSTVTCPLTSMWSVRRPSGSRCGCTWPACTPRPSSSS